MSFDIPSCVEGRKPRKGRICMDFFTAFSSKQDSLAVSVWACRLFGPSSSLTQCIIFIPRNVNHETFWDIRAAWRGVACGGPRNVPRSVSCSFNACIGTPISNVSLVYDFLAVTFHSISRKVARYFGQCIMQRSTSTVHWLGSILCVKNAKCAKILSFLFVYEVLGTVRILYGHCKYYIMYNCWCLHEVLWLWSLIVYEVLGTVRILHGRHEETGNNHHGIPEKKKKY